MQFLKSFWCPLCLGLISTIAILCSLLATGSPKPTVQSVHELYKENEEWIPPSENEIPPDQQGDLIRYGKELIVNTSKYLGPKGIVLQISNGMNCGNCHISAGTQNFGNPFSAAATGYPKYRDRSGRIESIEFRVNECMKRSLNGNPLDSESLEMKAIVAYVNWIGKDVPQHLRPKGAAVEALSFLDRAADPGKGSMIYINYCQRCHGQNGEGAISPDSTVYIYPPLWGDHSFNTSAGLLRLSALAGFIKNNMPLGIVWKQPQLTTEQAWDVAAFISSQPRPVKFFSYDWKDISKKPADYPFGPYADNFSEEQHRYGPFAIIKKADSELSKKSSITTSLK